MQTFELFGHTHLATLGLIVCVAAGFISLYRKYPRHQTALRYTLAVCTLLSYPLQLISAFVFSYSLDLETSLPLHLCDIAAIIGGIALIKNQQKLAEIAYFWGLAGTLQGLLTPNIQSGFPSPEHFCFFWNHGFVVITAVFLPLAMGWRPRPHALWFVFALTQGYAAIAVLANSLLGTNFGYLHHKPSTASLLDLFPAWPWYILILEAICLLFFFVLNLPFSKNQRNNTCI